MMPNAAIWFPHAEALNSLPAWKDREKSPCLPTIAMSFLKLTKINVGLKCWNIRCSAYGSSDKERTEPMISTSSSLYVMYVMLITLTPIFLWPSPMVRFREPLSSSRLFQGQRIHTFALFPLKVMQYCSSHDAFDLYYNMIVTVEAPLYILLIHKSLMRPGHQTSLNDLRSKHPWL